MSLPPSEVANISTADLSKMNPASPSTGEIAGALNGLKGPNIGSLLQFMASQKANTANAIGAVGNTDNAAVSKAANGPGLGDQFKSAAQNIIDYISTPFYIATNTANEALTKEDQGQDYQSLGSFLDDIRQGFQKGIDAGINHNPANAVDWVDVIKHAQQGTSDQGNDALANAVGIPMDLLIDPINALPGAGIAKGVLKGTGAAIKAAGDAGRLGEKLVAKGAEDAAGSVAEPILQEARTGAQTAENGGTTLATEAAPEAVSVAPAGSGADQFNSTPAVQAIKANQAMGKAGAMGNAFTGALKESVANSDVAKIIKGFKDGYNAPLVASPQNILQAHLDGLADKENLAKEPVATMAAPDKVKPVEPSVDNRPKAEEVKPTSPEGIKQEDLVSSAANNTLANKAWEAMPPEQRQATRVAEAQQRFDQLNKPIEVGFERNAAAKAAGANAKGTITADTQKAAAIDTINEVKAYQADRNLQEIGDKGYRGNPARQNGATPEEAGGIRHPILYDTHANQLPFQRSIDMIGRLNQQLAKTGRKLSRYSKLPYVVKQLKAVESNLQAVGMIPVLNLSKYAEKNGYIHLTMGDWLEAAAAKSVPGMKDLKGSTFTKDQLFKHIIGSSKKDAVNPMAMSTAMETLLHERRAIFDDIKKAGGTATASMLNDGINRAIKSVKDVLMGNASAYGRQATKEDLANIRNTIKDAITERGKGGAESYEKDMENLAKRIVTDPHLGTMLEQRHLYNEAMHSAELEKFTKDNWQDIKERMFAYAAGPWSEERILDWLQKTARDNRNLLPAVDRAQYTDWINDLIKTYITPAEQRAVKAVDPKTTIADSEKTAKLLFEETEEPYDAIELHMGKLATDVTRAIHPVKAFFDAKFPFQATSGFYDDVMMGNHSLAKWQNLIHQGLRQYLIKYNKEGQLLQDLNTITRAAIDKAPVVDESARELKKIIGPLFGGDGRYIKAIQSGRVSKDYLQQLLSSPRYGKLFNSIDDHWWADADKENLHEFWQHIQATDSRQAADFISKLHSAVLELNSRLSMAASFERDFGSKVAKEGYAHIKWNVGRGTASKIAKIGADSRASAERAPGFFDLLDKSLYFDKAAAWEIPALHRFINESRRLSDKNILSRFVNNVVDPTTQVMKATQTTLRPGHWISNVMGDTIRNFLAGVYDPRSYAYNMRILAAVGRDEKMFSGSLGSKFDRAITISRGAYSEKIPAAERKYMIPIRIKGTVKYYTATEIGRMLEDKIFLSSHGVGAHEDFINPTERTVTNGLAQAAVKATDTVLTNKFYDLQKYSALRDNLTRGALAVDTLIHGDHASIEDAMKKAFTRVRKWAPTSMDFSREESMYARRAIMYYTWLRGMIPNIVETMLEKPGVFLAPNKMLYGIAKANGVDPMSIGDPFPIDQMFPSYYYENVIGPQISINGALWGFSPMAPSIDVLDTMMNGINKQNVQTGTVLPAMGENLLNMANPFIKEPLELMTGQSGGVPITDPAQYLQDQNLPPQIDLMSKLAGKDIVGSGGVLQNRTDVQNINPTADILNYLTGIHATEYTSPAASRAVIGEAKAAKSAMRASARRNG